MKTRIIVAAVLVLAGCAGPRSNPTVGTAAQIQSEQRIQQELAFQQALTSAIRLNEVATRLEIHAADLCKDNVHPVFGFMPALPKTPEIKRELEKLYGIKGDVALLDVVPDGPLWRAGLRRGDVITSINGIAISNGGNLTEALNGGKIGTPSVFEYSRAGVKNSANVTPLAGCTYGNEVGNSLDLNAFADGKKVVVNQGMMNFATSDEELALVVSHELAHNIMKHNQAKTENMLGGLLADLALAIASRGAYQSASIANAAGQAYSQEFESEADYVGLYVMARAGYKIDSAPTFWRRMAVAYPASIKTNMSASHPSTASRMVALESAVKEIEAKEAANQPLVPNMKPTENKVSQQ